MRRLLLTLLLVLGCAGIASAQRSVIVTGIVRDTNGSLYVNGTGRASIIPPTGVQQPVVTIVSLGANASFSIQVADTSQVQPVNTAQWQFSFCSQGYVNSNGQTSQYCFTMTPMPIVGPGPVDISTQIQAQATILPTVIGGAFTAGGDLSGTNVSQTLTGIQGHSVSAGSPAAGDFLRYNGTSWLTTLLTGGDIPNNSANTSGNAATATALAATPTGCTGVNFSQGITATGTANCAQPSDVTGNAATATKLAGTPTQCSANNAPLGISSNGNAAGCFSVNQFSGLIPGTNANGPLHVGSGGSLDATGTGTIAATTSIATAGTPTKCISTQAATGINSDFSAAGCFTPGGGPPGGSTFDVQINNAGNLASGVTNQANVGAVGNIARKVVSTDSIRYVTSSGNDSNDGLSWGTAKLTVMAAYDALPATGGTVYICGQPSGSIVQATSTGQGIWIMGPSDPNYASPPAGWRQGKPISFIGSCGTAGDQQGNKPTVFVGANSTLGPWIWLSSMQGSNINPHFENLSSRYYSTAVRIGFDSNNAQTNTSGVFGASFDNIQTKMCNPTCTSGQGPGWWIGGGDSADLFFNNLVIQGNPQATPGSDNQAAMLFQTGSAINGIIATVTNSVLLNGEIKYYEPQGGSVITVKNVYSEALGGGSVTPGVGTFWAASSGGSNTSYHIEDVFTADPSGNVCNARFDPIAWHAGQITTVNINAPCSGGTANPTQQGSIVGLNLGAITGGSDPLTQNATGVSYGRYYGHIGGAERQFAPSMIRLANLAPSTSSSWTISGAGGTITTGIADPSGGTGAARVAATTNNVTITFYSQSLALAVGQYFVAGLYARFNSPDDYYDFSGAATYGLDITVTGSGDTVQCSKLWPPGIATDSWFWVYELCKVTAAPTTPATVTMTSSAPVVGAHTSTLDFFSPVFNNIAAGTFSNDEVYEYANALKPYNSTCTVGTLCGIGGTWQAPNLVVSSIAAGTSPICPNGAGGALTTSGCSGGGGGSSIIVNGGSPVVSPANFQNGAASLGDTFNMVQSGSNISTQLAAGSVRTVPGGGTGASTLGAHGPLIGEGTSAIAAAGAGLAGQCFLSNGASADPAFSNCPTGFTNPMSTVGDTMYGGGGGTATRLAGPTTPNGVSETLVEIPSSGAANPPQWSLTGVPVDAQTGPGYTVGVTDRASLITLSNAAPQNLTLVDPSTAGFTSSFPFVSKNIGSAAWTDVCTTFLCNGSASLLFPPNWSQFVWSNNSTYTVSRFPDFSAFANTGTNAAETFTSATGAFGSLTIGPASSTDGDLAEFNGTAGLPLKDSGILGANLTSNSTGGTTNAMPKWSASHTLTNSTLQDDATNVKLTTEPLDLVTKPVLEEVANASVTGTTVNKLAKLTGAPSTAVITTAGDTEFEGIVVGGAGTTGNAQIASAGSAVSCVFDSGTTAGDYVQNSASVNGDCTDAGASRPTSGGKIVGKVLSTNGGAGTYAVLAYGPDHPAISSTGSGPTLKTNGSNNTDQTALNLQNSSATNGITLTVTNTGTSNVQLGISGTLNNAGLTNAATTVNGQTCTLGSTCSVSPLISLDTTTPITVSTTALAAYYNNQNATAATAVTYNLPTAAAGKQFCFTNSNNGSAADTGVLTIATSATGQFIIFTDGTLSATGGNVTSGGAAADAACMVGIDTTHWQMYVQRGTWTKH